MAAARTALGYRQEGGMARTVPPAPRAPGRPLVLGHRGASAEAPENTLAAFRLALAQGADGVELDVWRCSTGEVVVAHDEDTRRVAGADLRVPDAPLAALRALDVGSWKGSGSGASGCRSSRRCSTRCRTRS